MNRGEIYVAHLQPRSGSEQLSESVLEEVEEGLRAATDL